MSRTSRGLLAICFFLSGATSLVLEVAWAKELSYSLGNSIYATSTVIAAFMAGLGLGSLAAGRAFFSRIAPIRVYALLQLLIGLTGFVSIFVLRSTGPLFEFVYQDLSLGPAIFLLARFLVVFPLMAVPATLMGMSLPLVVEARSREQLGVAANAGMFYGLNTLGAVTGTYLAGFVLIPALGLAHTCMAIGVVDFAVGLVLFGLHARVGRREPDGSSTGSTRSTASDGSRDAATGFSGRAQGGKRLFACVFFGAGLLAMVYEVAWFRVLANVLGGTVHAFTSMLGVFLIGVGLGSVLGTRIPCKRNSPFFAVAVGLFAIGIGAVSSLMFVNDLPTRYAALFWAFNGGDSLLGYVFAQALIAALVVLPTSLAMGCMFPLALRAYESLGAGAQDRKDASEIYALNTFGGICGSLAAGFVFLPRVGLTPTLMVAGAASALLALVVLARLMVREDRKTRIGVAVLGIATTALMAGMVPALDHLELHRGVFYTMRGTEEESLIEPLPLSDTNLLYYREGLHGSVAVTAGVSLVLRLSGKPVATSEFHERIHLTLLGHLPMVFAKSRKKVAVIGLGMGVALGAITSYPDVESIEVAELEPAILEVQNFFEAVNGNPLADPRVRLILEDGRTLLTYSEARYDIITSDPISPIIAGAANLYTVDFYRLALDRLTPGGIFCQWWEMGGISEITYKNVLATMREVFPHMLVFVYQSNSMILASMEPIRIDWRELQRRVSQPGVREDLAFHKIDSALHLIGLLWADGELVDRYVRDFETLNTDDNVWLEHQMPIDHYSPRASDPIPSRMAFSTAFGRLEAIEKVVPGIPRAELIEHVLRYPPTSDGEVHDYLLPAVSQYASKANRELLPKLLSWHSERENEVKKLRDLTALERDYQRAIQEGASEDAEQALRGMLQYPESIIFYRWGMTLVELLADQGRNREALDLLGELRRRTPSRSALYHVGLRLAEEAGDAKLALRYRSELQRNLSRSQVEAGESDNLDQLVEINWARKLIRASLFEDAMRHAQRALEIGPEHSAAHAALGKASFELGRRQNALEHYRAAISLNPRSEILDGALASVLTSLGKSEEALEYLMAAAAKNPGSSRAHLRIGVVLAQLMRVDEAAARFELALRLDPDFAPAHSLWGSMLLRQGKAKQAATHFELAIEIDPNDKLLRDKLNTARRQLEKGSS